ncbi:hypothetical protein [Pseudonocardia sp. H11422]|uniref:hypothetical protein n=1 Tax=Pseudonocardia sp. H11422 TaxID=2835866 RepID=UPI001BDDBAF3|nr:hypothetical protein [Pseudonocardia sp. H11422]
MLLDGVNHVAALSHDTDRQVPMFGRGRIDHLGLQAASLQAFEVIRRRLIARARPTTSCRQSNASTRGRTGAG